MRNNSRMSPSVRSRSSDEAMTETAGSDVLANAERVACIFKEITRFAGFTTFWLIFELMEVTRDPVKEGRHVRSPSHTANQRRLALSIDGRPLFQLQGSYLVLLITLFSIKRNFLVSCRCLCHGSVFPDDKVRNVMVQRPKWKAVPGDGTWASPLPPSLCLSLPPSLPLPLSLFLPFSISSLFRVRPVEKKERRRSKYMGSKGG